MPKKQSKNQPLGSDAIHTIADLYRPTLTGDAAIAAISSAQPEAQSEIDKGGEL